MRFCLSLLAYILGIYCATVSSAQTTLSFTSRGDLASTFGYSNPFGLSSEASKTIGARASFGLELSKRYPNNQALIIGLEYAISGFDHKKDLFYGSDFDTLTGTFTSSHKQTGAYRYDFIAFPLGYRWYGAQKKWRLYVQGSLIPMAYLRTITSSRIRGTVEQLRSTDSYRNDDFQTIHLAASTAVGIERSVFKSWTIGLQPTFRVHLNSVTRTEFKERPWTAGLQLNIGRMLGNTMKSNISSNLISD